MSVNKLPTISCKHMMSALLKVHSTHNYSNTNSSNCTSDESFVHGFVHSKKFSSKQLPRPNVVYYVIHRNSVYIRVF